MPRMTSQARRVADAMRTLGLPRSSWSVRTATRVSRGIKYYEDAYAVLYTKQARQAVMDNAESLRQLGVRVTVAQYGVHTMVHVSS